MEGKNLSFYLHHFSTQNTTPITDLHSPEQRLQFFRQVSQLMRRYDIYFRLSQKTDNKQTAAEQIYAYICTFILHKALADNQHLKYGAAYQRNIEALYKALQTHRFDDAFDTIDAQYRQTQTLLKKHQVRVWSGSFLTEMRNLRKNTTLQLNDMLIWLDMVAMLNRHSFAHLPHDILGMVYENYMRQFVNTKLGQVFTPPILVDLMLDEAQFRPNTQFIDPACGAGAFVLAANFRAQKIKNEPHLSTINPQSSLPKGLDIAPFPLFLAQVGYLMQNPDRVGEEGLPIQQTTDSIAQLSGSEHAEQYDFVLGNPPNLSYNECCKQGIEVFTQLKAKKVSLNNIYGVNLHSVPNNPKKYAPKPNLYAFFVAQALHLLKPQGVMCYLIPQTLLTAADLDTLRHHLARHTQIQKLLTFSDKVFAERGKNADQTVLTSSMILVVKKGLPDPNHQVQIAQMEWEGRQTLRTIISQQLPQQQLLDKYENWNFVTQPPTLQKFCADYEQNSQPMVVYYDHLLAEQQWGSRFYFDPGYMIDYRLAKPAGKFKIPRLGMGYQLTENYGYWHAFSDQAKDPNYIRLRQSSQGYGLLHTQHKIVWAYNSPQRFYYIAGNDVLVRFQEFAIGSNDETEILYLFGLLNSLVTRTVLDFYLKNKHEKDMLVGITALKKYVRVPIINTPEKIAAKEQLIAQVKQLFAAEQQQQSTEVVLSAINKTVWSLYFGDAMD